MRRHGWRAYSAVLLFLVIGLALWMRSPRSVDVAVVAREETPATADAVAQEKSSPLPKKSVEAADPSSEKARQTELIRALADDEICKVARLQEEKGFTANNLAAFSVGAAFSSDLAELAKKTSPFFGDFFEKFQSRPARFFQALVRSGLVEGISAAFDLASARAALLALEAEDPENAAYPYFRIAVESRLGASEEELLEAARAAAAKSRFDTFVAGFSREIFLASRRSTSHWLLGRSLLTTMPWPNFLPSNLLLKELSAKHGLFEETRAIAALLMKQGQETELTGWESGYSPVEYQVGRHLYTELIDRSPAQAIPTFMELDRGREIERFGRPYVLQAPFESAIDTKSCDRSGFDRAFREFFSLTDAH